MGERLDENSHTHCRRPGARPARHRRMLLSMEPDMEVVGQACDGIEAVALAEKLHPDSS